jgi:hypothetical protein
MSIDLQAVQDSIHPNLKLLSHSSSLLLHRCPRDYELYKLSPRKLDQQQGDLEDTVHLDFGDVVGQGVQEYLVSGSLNNAIMTVLKAWPNAIDDETGERAKKTFWHAINAVEAFTGFRKTVLSGYDLVHIDGKPAIELGFSIDLGNGFSYRGNLDALLIHRLKQELTTGECKTTKNKTPHEADYKNMGQTLGYSLIVDSIAKRLGIEVKSSFNAFYFVYTTFGYEWVPMLFKKSHLDRALWIKNTMIDVAHVQHYAEMNYFPPHGESCRAFGRVCQHFGTCHMSNRSLVGESPAVKVDDETKYQFKFHIDELIQDQLERHGA